MKATSAKKSKNRSVLGHLEQGGGEEDREDKMVGRI